ncbi:MAG TPA: zinc ABC transporter substrate-binding protein [Gemmataceae bacterium]|nr:zinc ABC transporter substrate-binding protein [Gemmataceae bacterium]
MRVVCTTTIVADVVQRVGGDRVSVEVLMGPGVDPHKYLPSAGDRAKLEKAHLVFFSGLHLEGKMVDTFEKGKDHYRAFPITRDIDRSLLRPAEIEGGGEFDPHVWFDVSLWMKTVGCVRDELSALDPGGAESYRRNADAYLKELDALDKEVRAKIDRVPKEKRVLVTSHDAFGYFGRAYGFEVRGLQGVSTASELGTPDLQRLAEFLGKNQIPAVFTETSVPPAGLQAVLETCRQDWKHEVKLIGGADALYSDALGEPGSPGANYPGMIRHNVDTIVKALAP